LAEIDWASLTHAYGSASEVPTLLRALASPKLRKREEALQTLFSHIWRDEMNDDLLIVPARYNGSEDSSEYEELLPVSPPYRKRLERLFWDVVGMRIPSPDWWEG